MKKTLMASALLLAGAAASFASVAQYDGAAALANARADVENWMSYLPDNMYVAHVSIPGTHDTATAAEWDSSTGASMSTTQSATIDEQLAGGIRAFDFRPGLNGGKLWCNHGLDRTKLSMEEAMGKLTAYLDAHPGEFFVIHFFRGNIYRSGEAPSLGSFLGASDSAADQQTYNSLVNELFNQGSVADYIVDYTPYLKVSDIRGKIVMCRRDRIDFANFEKAGNLTSWPSDSDPWNATVYATATNASNPGVFGIVQVTDISSPSSEDALNTELSSIGNLYNYTSGQPRPNAQMQAEGKYKPFWSMIFTSGAYPNENTAGYLTNATHTNPYFTSLVADAAAKGPAGIVFSDWVLTDSHTYSGTTYATMGIDLVSTIYENNFAYASEFILDDELFTDSDEEAVNLFNDEEGFLRNKATGKFLAAGANWGTHASLKDNGIRVTPVYMTADNEYLFTTTLGNGSLGIDPALGFYVDYAKNTTFAAEDAGDGSYYFHCSYDGTPYSLTASDCDYWVFDTPSHVALPKAFEGSEFQKWEFLTEARLLAERAASARMDAPADLSFMIHGHSFDVNDSENSKWVRSTSASYAKFEVAGTDGWNDKEWVYRSYNTSQFLSSATNYTIEQTVEGLPEGTYSLQAQMVASEAITFSVNGENYGSLINTGGSTSLTAQQAVELFRGSEKDKYTVTVPQFDITEGVLKIQMSKAASRTASSFCFDNFRLYYYGSKIQTGVENVAADSEGTADVYSLSGVLLRAGVADAEALEGLDKGIYIVRSGNTSRKVAKY